MGQTNFKDIDWAKCWRETSSRPQKEAAGSLASKQKWNEKAPSFTHKPKRSDYIAQLIDLLALEQTESVFDIGCGPGTLAIPLAKAGHNVIALDFSPAMLDELQTAAKEASVLDRITVYERSWQENWDDIPASDVALSSRSLITDDLEDALSKMESHALSRVVVTNGAGDLPYHDHRIHEAMGHTEQSSENPYQLMMLVNYLLSTGRFPRIDYITVWDAWSRRSKEDLEKSIVSSHEPRNEREAAALNHFLDQHIVYNEDSNRFELDYPRKNHWAYLEWYVGEDEPK